MPGIDTRTEENSMRISKSIKCPTTPGRVASLHLSGRIQRITLRKKLMKFGNSGDPNWAHLVERAKTVVKWLLKCVNEIPRRTWIIVFTWVAMFCLFVYIEFGAVFFIVSL